MPCDGLAIFWASVAINSASLWALLGLRWMIVLAVAAFAFRRRSLTIWILAGMIAGGELGHDFPSVAVRLQVLAEIFLRLVQVIIAPLLFSTLVIGIAGHRDLKKVGRMAVKALIYFEIVSTLALLIGFFAIRISRAGVGIHLQPGTDNQALNALPHTASSLILNMFPENIAKSVAEGQILQIVVFSVIFAIALALVPESKRRPIVGLADSLAETMFKFTNIVMMFAPVGVFGATAYTIGHMGFGILLPLSKLILTMYVALAVFVLLVLLPIALWVRIPLRRSLRAVTEPVAIAFATASSEAALPRTLEQMEFLGVSRETTAFVLATGYSFNLDGASIYQSLAVMFVAQAAGIHLSLGEQISILLTLIVSSKGSAGVARASLVVVLGVVASFHMPLEPVMLIFGIDQIMDMGRTAVSLFGNCVATMAIARWEGETLPFEKNVTAASTELPLL
jgi:Na+/H+-dicarboxylate symporter